MDARLDVPLKALVPMVVTAVADKSMETKF